MDQKVRIKVSEISKKFKIGSKNNPALGRVLTLLKREKQKELQVLKEVSFEVKEREILGLIGRNGSGKSTLLRVIAGIYLQDEGSIETNGKVFYLSGFDSGLMPRLTMKENIFLMCSVLGLSQKDIKKKFNDIVEFAGLRDFVYTEVDKFSSGMLSRLNFSITIHCIQHHSPDILLLDEVFGAGGDIDFQEKAIKRMEELITGGATVLMVSHNLSIIEQYCKKTLLMEKGSIKFAGDTKKAISTYTNTNRRTL